MELAMDWIGKQAGFYRGYLTDDRSLMPLAIVLANGVALWSLFYLVSVIGPVPSAKETVRNSRAMGTTFAVAEQSQDLANLCLELVRDGSNFPATGTTVLKDDPLVCGIPESTHEDERPILEVPLLTGEKLVFDGDTKNFIVK
jgi:hypothetical protein